MEIFFRDGWGQRFREATLHRLLIVQQDLPAMGRKKLREKTAQVGLLGEALAGLLTHPFRHDRVLCIEQLPNGIV